VTTLQIKTDDLGAVEEIKNIVMQKFHFEVEVIPNKKIVNNKSRTKWAEFADKMDGTFTPEIINQIKGSRKKARDNFIINV